VPVPLPRQRVVADQHPLTTTLPRPCLLAGLRMWAQAQYRSDQVVREILEAGDATALEQVARELRLMKNREVTVASCSVEAIAKWPVEQLTAVSSYALRVL
jgi:hypothetical protein